MELLVQHECTVTGTLGFVLRLSRVYGVASLKFEKVDNGWCISVSKIASIYGKAAAVITSLFVALSLTWDFKLDRNVSFHNRTTADGVLSSISGLAISLVLLLEAFNSIPRMQQVITCLAQIQKIQAELNSGLRLSFEKTERAMALCSLITGHIVVIIDCCMNLYNIYTHADSSLYWEFLYLSCYFQAIMLKVLILQISLIFTSVLSTFNHLNNCLKKLLQKMNATSVTWKVNPNSELKNKNQIAYNTINSIIDSMAVNGDARNESSNTTATTIHSLSFQYCYLCDIALEMDKCHGILLAGIMSYFLTHLILTPYHFIISVYSATINLRDCYEAIMQCIWLFYHTFDLGMIVETCHRLQTQTNWTKYLISQLLRVTPRENHEVISELKLFYKHLMLNEVAYSPKKLFCIDRTIIASILTSVTTYLVIVIPLP